MRKLSIIVSVLALFVLSIMPAFAQEDTIADIVVASTEAEEAEFTVLLAALQAASPAYLERVSDPDTSVTVFAPTDAAFTTLLEALGLTAEELLADTDLLNEVLAYHVVPAAYTAEEVVALDGAYIGTLLFHEALFVSVTDDGAMVNDSTIVTTDIEASNGIVHVIDTVLVPGADDMAMEETEEPEMEETEEPEMEETEEPTDAPQSIVDVVVASTEAEEPEFTILLQAVQAADPVVAETLSGSSYYTVFAPTDAAFAAALEALGLTAEELLADTETLTEILLYHVAPGWIDSADFGEFLESSMEMDMEGVSFATLLGGTSVTFTGTGFNDAGLVMADVMAPNGIIHVIDSVLLPPSDEE